MEPRERRRLRTRTPCPVTTGGPNVDYDAARIRACVNVPECARQTWIISKTTELLGRRRALRLDPNASQLSERRIPDQWKTSRTVLIHKKGDREDLRNYRPICLLSVLYKYSPDILTRISGTLDEAQPQEQAGFQGFSCLDHIQTVSRVIEVCRKYRLPLVLTFVDHEKAFDSVETNAILSALVDQGVDASYVRTLAKCYERCTTRIQLFHRPLTIPIGKGGNDAQRIERSREENRTTNKQKEDTVHEEAHCEDGGVQLEGSQIVETPSYVYLGRSMNMENDLKEELNRRMRAAWAAFAAVREATDQLTDHDLRAHLFDSTVLPALCYAAETWADTAATSRATYYPQSP
ncbi:hypothetical protein RB195_019893 [Necator americanus]|uniref:Reverse transcriptase domain-containing protein n=1 Tax=Necator americanus TaxID=51031 RepID=A0ABR1CG94_NECAM